ncbi:tetratricopeptide repeat protein [bacterium]|nr:tetratricopeptide repeat protein [bacterium]MBU3956586.1 tetratricopeptide repeat protein [bacterium]
MNAAQIQEAKVLREAGMFVEAAEFYLKILKQNPADKLAKLGYVKSLIKQGHKENIKPLLFRAEKKLFELIEDDCDFEQAHDDLIFLSHYLNHMDSLSKFYHEKMMQYPARDIYAKCIKKISATAMLTIPDPEKLKKKKKIPWLLRIIFHIFILSLCGMLVISLTMIKFRKLFVPCAVMLIFFIGTGVYSYIKNLRSDQW